MERIEKGWIPNNIPSIRIKFLCSKTFSGGTPSTNNSNYWNGTIPWIASGKLQNCIVDSSTELITEAGLRNSSTKLIKINSPIIFSQHLFQK
mgnify:CR=1 FL=1